MVEQQIPKYQRIDTIPLLPEIQNLDGTLDIYENHKELVCVSPVGVVHTRYLVPCTTPVKLK